jgi:hypothetical protein
MAEPTDRERETAVNAAGLMAGAYGPCNDDARIIADLLAEQREYVEELLRDEIDELRREVEELRARLAMSESR